MCHLYFVPRVIDLLMPPVHAQPSPRKKMIASEIRDIFERNSMVSIYHYNDLTAAEWIALRQRLSQNSIKIRVIPCKLSAKILEDTAYRNISFLLRGCTAVAYGEEAASLSALLASTASEPKLHLLGGILEDQMFTPKGLQECAKLPTIEVLRGELVGSLQLAQVMLSHLLQANPQRLSSLLTQIAEPGPDVT